MFEVTIKKTVPISVIYHVQKRNQIPIQHGKQNDTQ